MTGDGPEIVSGRRAMSERKRNSVYTDQNAGQWWGRTVDPPIFRTRDNSSPNNARVRDLHRSINPNWAIHVTGVAEPVRSQDIMTNERPRAALPAVPRTRGRPRSLERPPANRHVEKG